MDEQHEYQLRRQAIRWLLKHVKPRKIVKRLGRSRSWLRKWKRRFDRFGWPGLHSQSRAPHVAGHAYDDTTRHAVIAARQRLERRTIGLIGAQAARRELEASGWKRDEIPAPATIKRIWKEAGITGASSDPPAYFPQPSSAPGYRLQQMDWTEKVLESGVNVYAFHSIDVDSKRMCQTLASDKSRATVRQHLLNTWATIGIPDAIQMDNDAAFCGGYKVRRVFGACVRLCLFVGVEPIFIPPREPQRNGLVERLHGLWGQSFWQRQHFDSFAHVQRAQPGFERWYARDYLHDTTSACAADRRLTSRNMQALPDDAALPITEGRLHFVRQVAADGTIALLNETWHVTRRLAGKYVWATIITHEQRLRIYYKAAQDAPVRLLKEFKYEIPEPVRPLTARFRRTSRRRKMDTML